MGACDSDFGNPSPELTQEVEIWRKCACARKNRSETLKQHRTSLERRNFYTNRAYKKSVCRIRIISYRISDRK